jgi:hypothetical protein
LRPNVRLVLVNALLIVNALRILDAVEISTGSAFPHVRRPSLFGRNALAKTSSHSRAAKARWADPVVSEKIKTALRDPANRAKMVQASQDRWADPEKRAQMIAAMRLAGERRRRKTGDG